jgi:hypothetical protein
VNLIKLNTSVVRKHYADYHALHTYYRHHSVILYAFPARNHRTRLKQLITDGHGTNCFKQTALVSRASHFLLQLLHYYTFH